MPISSMGWPSGSRMNTAAPTSVPSSTDPPSSTARAQVAAGSSTQNERWVRPGSLKGRRRAGGFLQHGSVMLGVDAERVRVLFPGDGDPLAGMTTLEQVLGRRPGFAETAAAIAEGFTRAHGIELRPGGLTRQEQELIDRLVREKYGTAEWNERGRLVTDLSRVS